MKIEVNIENQLEEIWAKIGMTDDEIEREYDDLNEKVQALFRELLKKHLHEVHELTREAEKIEADLAQRYRNYGVEESIIVNEREPLRIRISRANERIESLEKEMETQKKEFHILYENLTKAFNTLEVKERGDFQEEGENFSRAKINRMTELLSTMKHSQLY